MTADHARRLKEIHCSAHPLAVIVTDPPQPILPQRARAELVAALDAVDYVIQAMDNTVAEILTRLEPGEIIQEEAADQRRTENLIAYVRQRQTAKGE